MEEREQFILKHQSLLDSLNNELSQLKSSTVEMEEIMDDVLKIMSILGKEFQSKSKTDKKVQKVLESCLILKEKVISVNTNTMKIEKHHDDMSLSLGVFEDKSISNISCETVKNEAPIDEIERDMSTIKQSRKCKENVSYTSFINDDDDVTDDNSSLDLGNHAYGDEDDYGPSDFKLEVMSKLKDSSSSEEDTDIEPICDGIDESDQNITKNKVNEVITRVNGSEEEKENDDFRCVVCEKNFDSYSEWEEHCKVHSYEKNDGIVNEEAKGEDPCICTDCGKCLSSSGNIKRHMRLHTGEKPFECSDCGHKSADKGNLNKHRKKKKVPTATLR